VFKKISEKEGAQETSDTSQEYCFRVFESDKLGLLWLDVLVQDRVSLEDSGQILLDLGGITVSDRSNSVQMTIESCRCGKARDWHAETKCVGKTRSKIGK
jgi:hypothetical protein